MEKSPDNINREKVPEKDWSDYYERTKNNEPSKLLKEAVNFVKNDGKAIDIGAGALKDTRFLLEQGFEVTAIDGSELMAEKAEKIKNEKFHYFISSFADFNFPENSFDIASAMNSLPFNPPETFDAVFQKIKNSLIIGGIFCAKLFGIRDEWSNDSKMTFHTKEQVEKLLSDMEIVYFNEEEKDGTIANGTPKHWHTFDFIARKK